MLRACQENSRKNIEGILSDTINYSCNSLKLFYTGAAKSRSMEQNTKSRNRPKYRSEFGI